MSIRAIAWASGLIEFIAEGEITPDGAIVFAVSADPKSLITKVSARARHSYDGRLLVPGVPEAETPTQAIDALIAWRDQNFDAPKAGCAHA